MKKIKIIAEIRKYGTVEVEVSDEDFAALENEDPQDVIGGDIDAAWEKADEAHSDIGYDYQIIDEKNDKIIVDWKC